jgi:hypothetical protein
LRKLLTYLFLLSTLQDVFAQQSILSFGSWYKMEIAEDGVYKIDKAFFLKNGIDTKNLNPDHIRLFVSPEKLLPQENSIIPNSELQEIPILKKGNNKIFADSDALLFYAENAHQVLLDKDNSLYEFQHPYADANYVFMNIGTEVSRKLVPENTTNTDRKKLETFIHFESYQPEFINLLQSGREWLGEYLISEITKTFEVEGRIQTEIIKLHTKWVSQTFENTRLSIFSDNSNLGSLPMSLIQYRWNDSFRRYRRAGEISEGRFSFTALNKEINLTFQLPADIDISSGAYLDFIELEFPRKIGNYLDQHQGYLIGEHSFWFEGAPESVWNVSDWQSPTLVLKQQGQYISDSKKRLNKYAFFKESNTLSPKNLKKLIPQNIIPIEVPNLVIIYPEIFKAEAEDLAMFRRTHDGLEVATINIKEIYNEFSGGKADPTAIRNLAKKLWLQNPDKFKYLLLFGDTNYDIKNNNQLSYVNPEKLIPTYESKESLEPIYSYSSDDYFGFLENHEGEWPEGTSVNGRWQQTSSKDHLLDISVGRLPVKGRIEAKLLVDKIKYYSTSKNTLGTWKRNIAFVADDADLNIHQRDAEKFSEIGIGNNSAVKANKVYLDAYPQLETEFGERSPQANEAFERAVNEGSLIINYNGHGSEDGWTDEKLLTLGQILKWRNKDNMPIFFTATCEFGRYDNPGVVSGAEAALLNPDGGAIALLTTTRPVFSSTNFKINRAFYNQIFEDTSKPIRLGDIFKRTKNESIDGVINRNFSLLGDPSMAIAYPNLEARLKSINNSDPENYLIQGQSKVKLIGEVNDPSFNGKVNITLYDKALDKQTFGGINYPKMSFKSVESKLFAGIAEVKNGKFTATFIVPRSVNEFPESGQIYFYAVNTDSTKEAIGGNNSFLIGGRSDEGGNDTTPPKFSLSVDSGTHLLTIITSDESGIDISYNQPNKQMVLIFNDTSEVSLNDYYVATDGYMRGEIKYQLPPLKEGIHTILLNLADVYNNSTSETLEFEINPAAIHIISNTLYPNPAKDFVNLSLRHNKPGDNLQFEITFFDISGKLVLKETRECYLCEREVNFGMNLEPYLSQEGRYLYKINAIQISSGRQSHEGGRLLFWK